MVWMVIMDRISKEMLEMEKCFRSWMALHSEEKLEIEKYTSGEAARAALQEERMVHLAVVDVTVKEGIPLAKEIRQKLPQIGLLLVADGKVPPTAYVRPDIMALSLLLRPTQPDILRDTCEHFMRFGFLDQMESEKGMIIENAEGKTFLPFRSIYYFEAREKKIYVRTRGRELAFYDVLDKLIEKLPRQYLRCHRSYIVNTDLIRTVQYAQSLITMEDDIFLPLSRSYKTKLKEHFHERSE